MFLSLAERLAASPHRWLIVTALTLLIALASALPQVDQLLAERSEQAALQDELTQAEETARRLPKYEQRVAEKTEELQTLRERGVDESRLTTLRTWLVSAARQSGCQVRRIDLAAPSTRPWNKEDDPLHPPTGPAKKTGESHFQLQTRPVAFSVTGASNEVMALLKSIDADPRWKHANSVELRPVNNNSRELQLDLSLWYFALVRNGEST